MNIPSPRSIKYDIGNYVYRHPGTRFQEIAQAMPGRRKNMLQTLISQMRKDGILIAHGDGLGCCLKLRQHFDQIAAEAKATPAVLLPPYRPAFKAYKPAPLMTREPIREISFVTLTSGVPVFNR
jgi:hypothetical protein